MGRNIINWQNFNHEVEPVRFVGWVAVVLHAERMYVHYNPGRMRTDVAVVNLSIDWIHLDIFRLAQLIKSLSKSLVNFKVKYLVEEVVPKFYLY